MEEHEGLHTDRLLDHQTLDFSLMEKSREKVSLVNSVPSESMALDARSPTVRGDLMGISVFGFEVIIDLAGGRDKLTKGVDIIRNWRHLYPFVAHWIFWPHFFYMSIMTIIKCRNWRENPDFCSEGQNQWLLVVFLPMIPVLIYERSCISFIRRSDHEPGCCEQCLPCFFPWVYSSPKTTDFLKMNHVIPFTSSRQSSYIDLFRKSSNAHEAIGPATVFVSHAYSCLFLDAFDAIAEWEKKNPRADGSPHYFYFDLFVNSQHGGESIPFEDLREKFAKGVQSTEQFLLFLTDIDIKQPAALSRSWCIFEIATAIDKGIKFDVIMSPFDEYKIKKAFLTDDFDEIYNRLSDIDAEKAQAREARDQENIQRVIQEDMKGFLAVNQLVISAMRKWITDQGVVIFKSIVSTEGDFSIDLLFIEDRVIKLLQDQGRFSEAEDICRNSLLYLSRMRSKMSTLNKEIDNIEGQHLRENKQVWKYEYRNKMRKGFDAFFNQEIVDRTLLLSKILAYQQKNDEAEAASHDATRIERRAILATSVKTRGEFHPETLTAMHNLADIDTTDNISERIDLYKKTLRGRRKALNDSHPDTLLTLRNLSSLLESVGRVDELQLIWPQAAAKSLQWGVREKGVGLKDFEKEL